MASHATNNFGAMCKALPSAGSRLIAAGTGDATEVTGVGVNRLGFGSGKLVIAASAINTADKVLNLTSVKLSYSADNSSFDTAVEQLAAPYELVAGTGAQVGSYELDIDFTGQKQYVKVLYTPNHTASGTDTAELAAVFVLGGAQTPSAQPVTRSA